MWRSLWKAIASVSDFGPEPLGQAGRKEVRGRGVRTNYDPGRQMELMGQTGTYRKHYFQSSWPEGPLGEASAPHCGAACIPGPDLRNARRKSRGKWRSWEPGCRSMQQGEPAIGTMCIQCCGASRRNGGYSCLPNFIQISLVAKPNPKSYREVIFPLEMYIGKSHHWAPNNTSAIISL